MARMHKSGDAARPLPDEPTTPGELHGWIVRALDVSVARHALLRPNSAPFDYLCFTFLGIAPPRVDPVLDVAGAAGEEGAPASALTRPERTDCVVWSNRGGGKTYLGAVATLLDLLYRPGIDIRILAGSLDQSKRMYAHLRRFFNPRFHESLAAEVEGKITERRITLKNGSSVELLAASQTSVRGTRVQKLRCDEVDLFTDDLWDAAQLTTRSKVCGGRVVNGAVECLSTMHVPHGVMHRLVREAHEGVRELFRWGVIDVLGECAKTRDCTACPLLDSCGGKAKTRDGPVGHITVPDALGMMRRVSREVWNTEMLCLRPKRTHVVLREFDVNKHVFDHDGPGADQIAYWALGMDFGMRSPTAILWCAVGHDQTVWVMDERVMAEVVLGEHIRAIKMGLAREGVAAWPQPMFIAPDPAGKQDNLQTGIDAIKLLKQHGYECRKSTCTRILDGIKLIGARLQPADGGSPSLFIHARCTTLIESVERYHFSENLEDLMPVKDGFDHPVDALRYLVQVLDKPEKVQWSSYFRR